MMNNMPLTRIFPTSLRSLQRFLFNLCFLSLLPAYCLRGDEVNLIPTEPGHAPDYFCTWWVQGYASGSAVSSVQMDALKEENIFGTGKNQGWINFYPRIRGDLIFVMDDSWDCGFDAAQPWPPQYDRGADILDPVRFPTYATSGTETEKLRNLNSAVQTKGWGGVGGWICAKKPGFYQMSDEEFFAQRFQWMNQAGWLYWKVDWGTKSKNVEWRHDLTNWARAIAPNLIIENARIWDCVPFSDSFRTYDVETLTAIPVTLNRVVKGLLYRADADAKGIINCEDEPVIGAALGCALGIMRYPFSGDLPSGGPDVAFPPITRDLKNRLDEVDRAVLWHRVAPPFKVDGNVNVDPKMLNDSWYFQEGEGYKTKAGQWSRDSAPARISRGLPLPSVSVVSGEPPFVIASRNSNGAVTVATLGRTICNTPTDRTYGIPLADVTLDVGSITGPIGIFGRYRSLTLTFKHPIAAVTLLAQDILDVRATDITSRVTVSDNQIIIPGDLIDQIGLQKGTPDDKSDPGMVISIGRGAGKDPESPSASR